MAGGADLPSIHRHHAHCTIWAQSGGATSKREIRAFGTPTDIHFCAALVISIVMNVPWLAASHLAACIGVFSGIGLALDQRSEDPYIIFMPKCRDLKSGKAMLLAALVLATPALTFARGESTKVHKSSPVESQKSTDKNRDMGSTSGGRVHKSNPVEWQESTNKNRDMGSTSGGRVHVETGPPSSGLDRTRAQDSSAFRK